MFPAITNLAQSGPGIKLATGLPTLGRIKTKLKNLFDVHADKINLFEVEADVEKMQVSGLEWILIITQLLHKYGPAIIDLLAELRSLFNK